MKYIYALFIVSLIFLSSCNDAAERKHSRYDKEEITKEDDKSNSTSNESDSKSTKVLKSFYLLEMTMLYSGKNIDDRNSQILGALQRAVEKEGGKAQPYYDAARIVDAKLKEYLKYIEDIKLILEEETGGRYPMGNINEGQLQGRDNTEKATNYMINEGHGAEIKNKVNSLHSDLSSIINELHINPESLLSLRQLVANDNSNTSQNWQSEMFENIPLAATMTILTKMQNDAKNAGSGCMSEIAKMINAR